MTTQSDEFENRKFPWSRTRFDLEGIVGALAAWMIGILLGLLWDPLFWLGVIAAVLVLMATRRSSRSIPAEADTIVSPVDGVLVAVDLASPPSELRLPGGSYQRLRISSSPASPNGVYAPMTGEIETMIYEAGEPAVAIAMDGEATGLATAFITLASGDERMGLRLATGGFGPRLDIDIEAGDPVRLGRKLGRRRLGGWCDIYLPDGRALAVWPGMTLVACETRLVSNGDVGGDRAIMAQQEPAREVYPLPRGFEGNGVTLEELVEAEPEDPAEKADSPPEEIDDAGTQTRTPPTRDDAPAPTSESQPAAESDPAGTEPKDTDDDAAEMFARLRNKIRDASKRDGD